MVFCLFAILLFIGVSSAITNHVVGVDSDTKFGLPIDGMNMSKK
jgi:hypothetical protein